MKRDNRIEEGNSHDKSSDKAEALEQANEDFNEVAKLFRKNGIIYGNSICRPQEGNGE